jgi:hypothetical protein
MCGFSGTPVCLTITQQCHLLIQLNFYRALRPGTRVPYVARVPVMTSMPKFA